MQLKQSTETAPIMQNLRLYGKASELVDAQESKATISFLHLQGMHIERYRWYAKLLVWGSWLVRIEIVHDIELPDRQPEFLKKAIVWAASASTKQYRFS